MPPSTATLPSAADALTALNGYQQPDSATVLGQAQQKYGIQGLQDRVNTYKTLTQNLTGAIAAVDPSVTGRTAGSLVTEGQRGALVNRERAPIVGQLGTADQGLSSATGDLNTADKNATNEANLTISDNKDKYNKLLQTYQLSNEREQQQAKAAAEEAARQEQIRQFNVSQQTARGSSSYRGGGSAAPSQSQVASSIDTGLQGVRGKDGYVSPQDYAKAYQDWVQAGFSGASFNSTFGKYKNPKNGYYNYAISQVG